MKHIVRLASVISVFLSAQTLSGAIITVQINDVIQPIVAEYAIKGISQAEAEKANAVILRLSTPGGLDQSMRQIIEKILVSKVPVIAFVGPSGARAASAGFFILLSADLAVMAPGTN
ncbi:MAG: serine protease, partial [Acidobacteria bacterium]